MSNTSGPGRLKSAIPVHLVSDKGFWTICGRNGVTSFVREEASCSDCLNPQEQLELPLAGLDKGRR